MCWRKFLIESNRLAAAMLLGSAALAEAADEAQIRAGLEALAAHIAPAELSPTARWVQVQSQGQRKGIFDDNQGDAFRIEGNALLLNEKKGVEAQVLWVSSATIVTLKQGLPAEEITQLDYRDGRMPSTWRDGDLDKDTAAAIEWLAKAKKAASKTVRDPFGGGAYGRSGSPTARALIWAALLMHTGHAEDAVKMASVVLKDLGEDDLKKLLDECFGYVASTRQMKCTTDFATHHQWSRLRDELSTLVSQFPLGWGQRDAVRVLAHQAGLRAAAGQMPPITSKPTLPEADQKLLLSWITELESGKEVPYSRWVLPALSDQPEMEDENTTRFPASHGLKALPMLAALLTDETLTGSIDFSGGYFSHYDSDATPEERLRSDYEQLTRTKSRADLAWEALERGLPQGFLQNDLSFAERASEVLSWYAKVKDLKPADLALEYLEAGDQDAKVLAHVMRQEDPKKLQRVQANLIENAQVYTLNNLTSFVSMLGPEKAPAFLTQLRTKLEADASSQSDNAAEFQKMIERSFKKLDAAAKGGPGKIDLDAAIQSMLSLTDEADEDAQMEAQENSQLIMEAMSKMPRLERMTRIYPRLPELQSTRMVGMFLSVVDGNGAPESKPLTADDRKTLLSVLKTSWTPFLEKQLSQKNSEDQLRLLSSMTYCLNPASNTPADNELIYTFYQFGSRAAPVYRDWIDAVLEEKEPPAWPNADSIPEAKSTSWITAFDNKTVAEIREGISQLTISQLLAYNQHLKKQENLSASWKSYLGGIQSIQCPDSSEAVHWQVWLGKSWSYETILGLAQQAAKSDSEKSLIIQLVKTEPILGWKLSLQTQTKTPSRTSRQMRDIQKALGDSLPKISKRLTMGQFWNRSSSASWNSFDTPVTDAEKAPPLPAGDDLQAAAELLKQKREQEIRAWKTIQDHFSKDNTAESAESHSSMINLTSIRTATLSTE